MDYKGIVDDQGRECTKCGEYKPWSEYNKDKSKANGYNCQCRVCSHKYMKANRERHLKVLRDWRLRQPGGVYLITTREGRYVGQSNHMHARVIIHPSDKTSPCLGKEVLEWEVLEYIEDSVLRLQREKYWIKKLDPELNRLNTGKVNPRISQ